MAPSPAAGGTPKTPTKLGRKPQSRQTPKLGQASKPSTPQVPQVEKPEAGSPDTSQLTSSEDVQGIAEKVPEQAEEAAEEVGKVGKDTSETATSETGDLEEPTGKVSEAAEDLKEAEPKPVEEVGDTAAGAQETAEGVEEDVEDIADDATEKAGDITEDIEDTGDEAGEAVQETTQAAQPQVGEAAEGVQEETEGATNGVQKTTEAAQPQVDEAVEGVQEQADEATNGVQKGVGDVAEDVQDAVPEVPDLSILKGLEVQEDGKVLDKDGNQVGELVEGDAEDLVGYTIGDDGEILDDDGDLVGRCEVTPEKVQELAEEAEAAAEGADDLAGFESKLPGLEILKGLHCDATGNVWNDEGDPVGQIVEGTPSDLVDYEIDENGEILDEDGDLIGRVELHPDLVNQVKEEFELEQEKAGEGEEAEEVEGAEGVEGALNGVKDEAEGTADAAKEGVEETAEGAEATAEDIKETAEETAEEAAPDGVPDAVPEAELPGVEALEGQEINSEGEILDAEGNVLGQVAEGEIDKVKGMTVNDQGEIVDEEGNVIGKVELAEGAAEKLKDLAGAIDLRILEGLKVNKKGKILDSEGEELGELIDGDPKECAGKLVNGKGEVVDKQGNVLGRVKVIPGEAADEAMTELRERLDEVEEAVEEGPKTFIPNLDILEGLKVNKKGKILNEDGDEIGELVQGELKDCAGKKINAEGEVLDADGNIIGRVKTLPQDVEEGDEDAAALAAEQAGVAEEAEEAEEGLGEPAEEVAEGVAEEAEEAEEAVEDAGPELPPLSILDGLKVNKAGKIVDDNGVIIGELIEGDAKKLSKSGITCDAEGQFWDTKGHVIGRATTVHVEEPEEEGPFAGLEGLLVTKDGKVEDENGNIVGEVVEGDPKKLVGRAVDEDGDIIDKKGSVVGHAERWEEPEEELVEEEAPDLSILAGRAVNKQGNVIGDEGVPIGRLVEGNAKELAGKKCDELGQIWNDAGKVIGRCELIPEEEREAKPEGPFAGLVGLRVIQDGQIADEDDNVVGTIVEGNPKRLIGLSVDEDGDIIDKYGNVKGHAEPLEEEEEEPIDYSILDGKMLNKQGYVIDDNQVPIGRLVEGNLSDLAGRRCDELGQIHSDTGKVVGRCEPIPENERVAKPEGPFSGFEGLRVVAEGKVEDADGNVVGILVEGDPKRLVGHAVDEDGDIIDKWGNVKGHADPYEEEEPEEIDLSALAGCTVNKAGNVVDSSGTIIGRVAEGDVAAMIGKKVDGQGQIWDNAGNVVGRAELVHGAPSGPEGPFAGWDDLTVAKDGTVVTPSGDIVGRVIEGEISKLVGHKVDEDGDINDKNGNQIGKAERWEPEEKERRVNPMSGRRVNREGEVRDEEGNIMGRLTAGDLGHCAGLEIDDNGYVIDNDGNKVGEVTLLENIVEEEEEEEEGPTEEELQRQKDAEIADKMANICQQTLERVQPVCKQITDYIEAADRTPRDELDEEELVNNVKPLIEEGGRILQECNGSLRGLDPDGRIAAQAKGRAGTREATPEEYRLADCLKELTTTVVTTIDNAKKKIADMPHAKKKLNPLWALLTEPLFQILAAVGLLLAGVLGLVGRLLNGLGLGGLVNGLLGGLGIDKLLGGLGLGSISEALGMGGDKKKKKKTGGGASGLPLIGGMFGGK